MKKLPDYIEDSVTAISTLSRPVYYLFGNWKELCEDLADKSHSSTYRGKRYPLVLLHNDYQESQELGFNKVEVSGLKLYVICQSEAIYTTQQRKELIYDLILKPIYDDLIIQMKKGSNFQKKIWDLPHEMKGLYRLWVGDKINKLPDDLDAIEITFKTLIYNLKKFS